MALFTDGTISTLEDLRAYESAIYDVASTERIDLSQKLVLAQQELEVELTWRFFREDPGQLGLVVVTRPLRLWHTFQSLALTYRDAYNSHLNDRYQGKWREYEKLAQWACRRLFETGIGMVAVAVPKAPVPSVTASNGNAEAAMYWARASWVGANGTEGCASNLAVLAAAQGTVPTVEVGEAPEGIEGWNVFVGYAADQCELQNDSPIPIGENWVMGSTGLAGGRKAGTGQSPAYYKAFERTWQRG